MLTDKSLSNSLAQNETTNSVIQIAFSKSLIHGAQVQVDSIIQVDSTVSLTGRQHRAGKKLSSDQPADRCMESMDRQHKCHIARKVKAKGKGVYLI